MKNNLLKGLIALIGLFIFGYSSLVGIHIVFGNIIDGLDNKVKNEYARNKIGEYILKEISNIETQYYKMAIHTNTNSITPIQKNIKKELDDIRKAIDILQNGGTLDTYIKLNIVGIDETIQKFVFTPNKDKKYTFEAIDLKPKLDKIEIKIYEIDEIIDLKNAITANITQNELKRIKFKIQIFFKQIPSLFVRMKENANRLLYDSKKNLDLLEINIKNEKQYYKKLEIYITFIVMAFALMISYFVIKQIFKENEKLKNLKMNAEKSAIEASRASKIKSQFLANMSHEIRTPLNAIIGFSELLSKEDIDQKSKEKASIITKSASALLNIINDILDISKVESGKFEISNNSFNLKKLLEQIVQLYSVSTKEKNIDFVYNLGEGIPKYVNSDETRIKQILSNILSNAIKFTPENKKVLFKIELKKIENGIAKIMFLIKDEGIGISASEQKNIFEPFSQADGSISRKFGGTGLGLSISHKIIKMLGSNINLISKEGKGSTFYFDLDLKIDKNEIIDEKNLKYKFAILSENKNSKVRKHLETILKEFGSTYELDKNTQTKENTDLLFCIDKIENIEEISRKSNSPIVYLRENDHIDNKEEIKEYIDYYLDEPIYGSKIFNIIAQACSIETEKIKKIEDTKFKGKILVAEDNTNNQLLIDILLKNYGLDVTIVDNGQKACEKCKENDYDLILMDINMPIMDGITALKIIKKEHELTNKYTPIIALTANTIKGDKEYYLEQGMDSYLSKPIENEKLLDILRTYLSKNKKLKSNENNKKEIEANNSKINSKVIAERLGVGENIAQLIINKFKSEIIDDLEDLENSIESKNYKEISDKAHFIKNSCLNVSLDEACDILQELEKNEDIEIEDINHKFAMLKELIKSEI